MTSNIACGPVITSGDNDAISINSLTFGYPGCPPFVSDFTLKLPRGSRCLLIGANGAGKSTLLQIMAGKFLVPEDAVRIIGRPAFHDLQLTSSGELSYLGSSWRRDVAFAGYDMPLQGDIGAGEMIFGVDGVDPARREKLIHILDIDLDWRMNTVSDGQRRRVQICMGLLKPYEVLLLDEITVDMDVLGRLDLLEFFRQECEERSATIVYATHIFDGLEPWITDVAYVAEGKLLRGGKKETVLPSAGSRKKLLLTVEAWLREDYEKRKETGSWAPVQTTRTPANMPSKHMAFFR
uniref:CCR4-NOT complex subunit CAF16 n=1 Tax=Tetraselmis sp. GSL018 TaxID=582737 RepID=A0A061R7F4_9CHLO|eukprot:CAMPEP_0177590982 /NCGR_PEP_ID=MMETSP0419_2-20121207/7726_1 /TAXON_ID=582737 /ORGANISM="Tetraselmis sp., Strain GSL018" /LENGTH=293 /DNA_ID=CAMNT_0019081637 /DNA_START=181 /DNA_END=1062 /DNA_ORIENTATION=+